MWHRKKKIHESSQWPMETIPYLGCREWKSNSTHSRRTGQARPSDKGINFLFWKKGLRHRWKNGLSLSTSQHLKFSCCCLCNQGTAKNVAKMTKPCRFLSTYKCRRSQRLTFGKYPHISHMTTSEGRTCTNEIVPLVGGQCDKYG